MLVIQINLSEALQNQRLDPEYYDPIALKYLEKKVKWTKIGKVLKYLQYGSSKALNENGHGYKIYRLNEIENCFLTRPEKFVILGKSEYDSLVLKKNDVLFCRTNGNIEFVGRTGLCNKDSDAVFASYLIRVNTDENLVLPEYLVIYLSSTVGRAFIKRQAMQSNQFNVSGEQLKKIPIPLMSMELQSEIKSLVNKSYNLIEKSNSLLLDAESVLLKELNLPKFSVKHKTSYSGFLSETSISQRLDAEHFHPDHLNLKKFLIRHFDAKRIGKIPYISVTTGQYSEKYVSSEEGKPYIRGTNIDYLNIVPDYLFFIHPKDQVDNKKTKEGDVVTVRVGSIGKSARIPKECDGGTFSDNLIRLRTDESQIDSYYLALYLSSRIGTTLILRSGRGSVQQRLNQETLKEVLLPTLPMNKQRNISKSVRLAQEKRNDAKNALDYAKQLVVRAVMNES